MPFQPEDDLDKVRTSLGMPRGRETICIEAAAALLVTPTGHAKAGDQNYRIIQWGVLVDHRVDEARLPSWPHAVVSAPDGRSRVYQLWLIQCYRPGYPLAAERRWNPDRGTVADAVIGLEEPHTQEDLLSAWEAHAIIQDHQERSREEILRDILLQTAVGAAHRLIADGLTPTFPRIMARIAVDEPGLEPETLKKRWDRRTPPIRMSEVLRRASVC